MSNHFEMNTLMVTKEIMIVKMKKTKKKRGLDYKQFEIIDNRDQRPKSTKKRRDRNKIT